MRFKWQKEPSILWNGLCLIDIRSPIAQAHIFAGSNKTPGFGMSVLSTILGGSCWQVSVDSIWLLPSCLLFQLMKTKWVRWNKEKTPLGNEVDWLAQVVGAFQKKRRLFLKEATMLKGSSQYTLRYYLTAMYREVIIWDQNIVES